MAEFQLYKFKTSKGYLLSTGRIAVALKHRFNIIHGTIQTFDLRCFKKWRTQDFSIECTLTMTMVSKKLHANGKKNY